MNNAKRRRQQKTILVASPQPAETSAGHYFPALLVAGESLAPGTVQSVDIFHDDWCDLLHSRGACNCNPEIQIAEIPPGG
jgi:hypothetical protein